MKKPFSLFLVLALLLPLLPEARAAEGAAPAWIPAERYLTFPGDPVYEPEAWARVLEERQAAEEGALLPYEGRDWAQGSVGECYETGLIRLRCAENYVGDAFEAGSAFLAAGRAFAAAESGWYDRNRGRDETYYRLSIEKYRAFLIYHVGYVGDWGRSLVPALDALSMTMEDFFNAPYMDRVSVEDRAFVAGAVAEYQETYDRGKNRISVSLDGEDLIMDTPPQVSSQRTMVPLRSIAEALGADVTWEEKTNLITLTRAGSTVTMTIGKTAATVDGKRMEMDVAPYADGNRTYVPARYVSEFFGQTVSWNGEENRVEITEKRGSGKERRTEAKALPMGALLDFLWEGDPTRFGLSTRGPQLETVSGSNGLSENRTVLPRDRSRELLEGTWGIDGRETLLETVNDLLEEGDSQDFRSAAKEVWSLSDREIARRTKGLSETDQYMWPWTKALWNKWTSKGLRAWDLCRCAAFLEWGYTAGYVTYREALEFLEPATEELTEKFDTWDEVYENFLEGYYWCLREDLGDKTVWDTDLGMAYQYLKNSPDTRTLFNNELLGEA